MAAIPLIVTKVSRGVPGRDQDQNKEREKLE